ncbi:MAG: hypothetical protein ACRDHY_03630 [Anaerolineales bacterium]
MHRSSVRIWRAGALIVTAMFAASCASPATQAVGPAPTVVDTPLSEATLPPSQEPSPEVVLPPTVGPTPTVRPGMEATDPTTVVLASGDPTLVEFFAFW